MFELLMVCRDELCGCFRNIVMKCAVKNIEIDTVQSTLNTSSELFSNVNQFPMFLGAFGDGTSVSKAVFGWY